MEHIAIIRPTFDEIISVWVIGRAPDSATPRCEQFDRLFQRGLTESWRLTLTRLSPTESSASPDSMIDLVLDPRLSVPLTDGRLSPAEALTARFGNISRRA